MFIQYNRPNNHVLTSYTPGLAPGGVMAMPEQHVLRPGWQEFPKRMYDLYKDDPEMKAMVKSGAVVISDVIIAGEGKKAPKVALGQADVEVQLTKIEEKKAQEIVAGTFNRELLQRWLDEENRSKVKRALEKRMKDLFGERKE